MKKKDRNDQIYLEDILISMERIIEYIGEKTFEEFVNDNMVVDAVVRNFEIIGEATNNVPEEIKNRHPDMPWRKMYGLRNVVSHAYFGIDHELIWEITQNNLPENIKEIKRIIDEEKTSGFNQIYE
ncbi:MAG: DUF86 domain-containing protein [Bacteroidota bacterium]